jgi:hypothetical protein
MPASVRERRIASRGAADAFASLALLAAATLGAIVLVPLVLFTLVFPFAFPLVRTAAATIARLEEARRARICVAPPAAILCSRLGS